MQGHTLCRRALASIEVRRDTVVGPLPVGRTEKKIKSNEQEEFTKWYSSYDAYEW